MTTFASTCLSAQFLRSNVQKRTKSAQKIPQGVVLLHVLKTLETEMGRKGLLGEDSRSPNPLWFLAETERNVFLWRRGCSLSEENEFEFWVDIPALIKKRLTQLSQYDTGNPFMNPDWGAEIPATKSAAKEERYLNSLFALLTEVRLHLEALSLLGSSVARELIPGFTEREVVVLPFSGPIKRNDEESGAA